MGSLTKEVRVTLRLADYEKLKAIAIEKGAIVPDILLEAVMEYLNPPKVFVVENLTKESMDELEGMMKNWSRAPILKFLTKEEEVQ